MNNKSTGYRGKFIALRTAKKKKVSSAQWLTRHLNDPYVAKSKIDGYRSRAAYKLLEIQDKFKIFRYGQNVIDLGSAPGSWSQIAAEATGANIETAQHKVIAIDLLTMESINGVIFHQGDFYTETIQTDVMNTLRKEPVDVVLSDMAANTTGHKMTDHLRTLELCEAALLFALDILKSDGHFIAKIFMGGLSADLLKIAKDNFKTVKHFKPKSSRKESNEFYLVALHRKVSLEQ